MRWHEQKLGVPLDEFLRDFRGEVREQIVGTGTFQRTEMDHGSSAYLGAAASNKRVVIAAGMILGREPVDFDEALAAVIRVALS